MDEKELERQMGCMAGFLQIFDRHQILAGKCIYAAKRLPSSSAAVSRSPSERSDMSVASFASSSPEKCPSPPAGAVAPMRPTLPLPVFGLKEEKRKLKEAPRLSLDSRAIVDGKGKIRPRDIRTTALPSGSHTASAPAEDNKERRSLSVVARLMGLDALPDSADGETSKGSLLRRSASESRILLHVSRFVDADAFTKLSSTPLLGPSSVTQTRQNSSPAAVAGPPVQLRSYFEDFYPESKQNKGFGEVGRRLRSCGFDEPATPSAAAVRDLETLKQILEAVQLKGLIRSHPREHHPTVNNGRRNYVLDNSQRSPNPPIVVMKPAMKAPRRRSATQSPPSSSRPSTPPPVSSSNDHRRTVSPAAGSPAMRRRVSPEPLRKSQHRRCRLNNNVQSPNVCPPRSTPPDHTAVRSPRKLLSTAKTSSGVDDDASISESSFSSCSSHLDYERSMLEYKGGRRILERCDKLLSSIAAFTSAEQVAAFDQQPSPISVLDSSFLTEDNITPPVSGSKRQLHFKDQLEADWDDRWEQAISSIRWKIGEEPEPDDPDFIFVSDIVRFSDKYQDLDSNLFVALEKRHLEPSLLHRRLLFDMVAAVVDRRHHVSHWEAFVAGSTCRWAAGDLLLEVWTELRRAKDDVVAGDDMNKITVDAIKKDMDAERQWEVPAAELSDAALHIERQLFKDIVGDTIRDFAEVGTTRRSHKAPRRKLVF